MATSNAAFEFEKSYEARNNKQQTAKVTNTYFCPSALTFADDNSTTAVYTVKTRYEDAKKKEKGNIDLEFNFCNGSSDSYLYNNTETKWVQSQDKTKNLQISYNRSNDCMLQKKFRDNSLPQWKNRLKRAEIDKTNHSLRAWLEKEISVEGLTLATNHHASLDWASILTYATLNMICDCTRKALLRQDCKSDLSFEFNREEVHASHFYEFLQKLSKASHIPCPIRPDSIEMLGGLQKTEVFIKKLFGNENRAISILSFFRSISESYSFIGPEFHSKSYGISRRYHIPPKIKPSPFETSLWSRSSIIVDVLSFLGDPVVTCYFKAVNTFCRRIIVENEHKIMRNAVRTGGLRSGMRHKFWRWIILDKCQHLKCTENQTSKYDCSNVSHSKVSRTQSVFDFRTLEQLGRASKWASLIERDVTRAFGNLPPHKANARPRADSIVRALISWGKNRLKRHGPKRKERPYFTASCNGAYNAEFEFDNDMIETDEEPLDTVSDWGGISQSFDSGMFAEESSGKELALSGNALSNDVKLIMQEKLGKILRALSALHPDVGYCQGMDYIAAHLLRVIGGDIKHEIKGNDEMDTPKLLHNIHENTLEETVFRIMTTIFSTYNLRHVSLSSTFSWNNGWVGAAFEYVDLPIAFHVHNFVNFTDVYASTSMS